MNAELPIEGKAFRFAPARGQAPSASFWKVWSEGSEVYLAVRTQVGEQHISVHQSGAIHYRIGQKQRQDLAPLMPLASQGWAHAVELRFLIRRDSPPPPNRVKPLKKGKAYVLPVPDNCVLHANLLIGDSSLDAAQSIPSEFLPAAAVLWRSRLRDGRTAVLIGRLLSHTKESEALIDYYHSELKPTVTFTPSVPNQAQMELHHMHWSPSGGNVVLIVPMGPEALRSDEEPAPIGEETRLRHFSIESDIATQSIIAPDGRPVVAIRLDATRNSLDLYKGRPTEISLGLAEILLLPENLAGGNCFVAEPVSMRHIIRVSGASPRDWSYMVVARFDGNCMSVEIKPLSIGLRNANFAAPLGGLEDHEEITLTAPMDTSRHKVTASEPRVSFELLSRVCLRDQR